MNTITKFMENNSIPGKIAGWIFGLAVLTAGLFNLFLVHPVPGIAYLIISLFYFPPLNAWLKIKTGFSFPAFLKVVLAIALIIFTFGVSDLGDMID